MMLNADDPNPWKQIHANIKSAIGGRLKEPRHALSAIVLGMLSNPGQCDEVKRNGDWDKAFEEGVRWVLPISASGRRVSEEKEICGVLILTGEAVMTIQASASCDENIVEDGEVFNVHCCKIQHQSFGNGPYFCKGTDVARRAVAQVMLPVFFSTVSRICRGLIRRLRSGAASGFAASSNFLFC